MVRLLESLQDEVETMVTFLDRYHLVARGARPGGYIRHDVRVHRGALHLFADLDLLKGLGDLDDRRRTAQVFEIERKLWCYSHFAPSRTVHHKHKPISAARARRPQIGAKLKCRSAACR